MEDKSFRTPGDGDLSYGDAYLDAAFIGIALYCEKCSAILSEDDLEPTQPKYSEAGWVEALANLARQRGWRIEYTTGWDYVIYCPTCSHTVSDSAQPLLPPRRWFQFKLSTWFVLVAIVAWAMVLGPNLRYSMESTPIVSRAPYRGQIDISLQILGTTKATSLLITFTPLAIAYPAVALAAFVGWKAAWAIVERRRKRTEVGAA